MIFTNTLVSILIQMGVPNLEAIFREAEQCSDCTKDPTLCPGREDCVLGKLLLEKGVIDKDVLELALKYQRQLRSKKMTVRTEAKMEIAIQRSKRRGATVHRILSKAKSVTRRTGDRFPAVLAAKEA